jgi:hypothetical protein
MSAPFQPCACQLHRRRLLQLAGGAGLAGTFPLLAIAAPMQAAEMQALLLICNEPRVWQYANNYMKKAVS